MYKVQNDRYRKARGGSSRILAVSCEGCGNHVTYYQKDGPGMLKRMYIDRFIETKPEAAELVCESCGRVLGMLITYKKENRLAYRLFAGSVIKKIVRRDSIA
ncbi:MAG TPA: hypothetical protein VLG36_03035 [Candidatus Chromulinivoraceae bacterium]|nr:hypothetical protein [Candidatus Chromulinivoraceae bacterium]